MGFKDKLKNDETFENGIARFEIETDYPSDIIWRKGDFFKNIRNGDLNFFWTEPKKKNVF